MIMVRELFWLSAIFDFRIVFVPGVLNFIPDAITRLHQPEYPLLLGSELGYPTNAFKDFAATFPMHMSMNALVSVHQRVVKYSACC